MVPVADKPVTGNPLVVIDLDKAVFQSLFEFQALQPSTVVLEKTCASIVVWKNRNKENNKKLNRCFITY